MYIVRVWSINWQYLSPPTLPPPQLMYTGSGHVFGVVGKDVPKGEWKMVELPDKNVKVEHCSCDNTGTFSLVVTDKGVVYFGGLNKKGEAAEPGTYVHTHNCMCGSYVHVSWTCKAKTYVRTYVRMHPQVIGKHVLPGTLVAWRMKS